MKYDDVMISFRKWYNTTTVESLQTPIPQRHYEEAVRPQLLKVKNRHREELCKP
ncbi:hypothetical protein [Candidatus Tisiphia endosymbiont of Thecophora atra]|uniref:hypothetical protein n=1 Tax=Candidatus Tisiphia endosymbiont of Thecophora atra TaxID=3066258 RepID=UPI00312C9AED